MSETPAETLRRAAKEMRKAVTPSAPQGHTATSLRSAYATAAVADWLVVTAEFADAYPGLQRPHVADEPCDDFACQIRHAALKTARTYLGEEGQHGVG